MKPFNVAIDGTAGVGKSSVSDRLAAANGMVHLDTGAMYRCVALALQQAGTDLEDAKTLQAVLSALTIAFDGDRILLNGNDVSQEIRTNEISNLTSQVAAIPAVRQAMGFLQKDTTRNGGWIVDGRDIGTVILPEAPVKLYLSASPEARAQRRYDEYKAKGMEADYDRILADIRQRDWNDSHRKIAPLRKAEDAVEIDTSELTLDEVVAAAQRCIDQAKEAL